MIILDPYYFISNYNRGEIAGLSKKINIIYRNYKKPIKEDDITNIKNECRKKGNKFFLSNNIKLAIKLKLDGIYIPSFNNSLNIKYKSINKFKIIGSAHNLREIRIKEMQGVSSIFLSPVFKINKRKKYLGINKFNLLCKLSEKKIIALGGINIGNIKRLRLTRCEGYAGMTYLKSKKYLYDIRR